MKLEVIQSINTFTPADQSSKLRCPHKKLDEALKSLLANLTKQVQIIELHSFFSVSETHVLPGL